MADNKERGLLSEFPPVPTGQWEEVINADLKGADYEKKLVWRTAEGFNVRPYYRAEDLKGIQYLGAGIAQFPYVRSTSACNSWNVHQTIDVRCFREANAEALRAIASGTEAVGFRIKAARFTPSDLDTLLSGIDLSQTGVVFTGKHTAEIADAVLSGKTSIKLDKETTRLSFMIDPIITRLSLQGKFGCCPDGSQCYQTIAGLIAKARGYKKIRVAGVNGQVFHNSGSTIVQELAFTLAAGHEYVVKLMEAGADVENAARNIRFNMAVSSNYFMEIAKFRAARMLWATIMRQYQPKCPCAEKMYIHAVTSKWNLTAYDAYVNMLRGTTEAMSAAIAAVQSLEVLPFNAAYERPTDFSARIARNVQLLLKNESHFDSVVDPAGGSYYIEHLTQSIAQQAWQLFKQVEEKGGYTKAFEAGFIQDQIEAAANKKDMNIATRRQILLGTNQYPNFSEVAGQEVTEKTVTRNACDCGCEDCNCGDKCNCGTGEECTCGCDCGCDECNCGCDCEGGVRRLRPYRGAMAFEEMRLSVDRSGKEVKVFMLTAGTLAMARARSQFSSNFFGCAGFRIQDNTFFKSVEEGANEALASNAQIVVLCAADDDYAELAPKAKAVLGDKAILVIAGAPASQPELEGQGIDHFISVKSNVLETLRGYIKELGL